MIDDQNWALSACANDLNMDWPTSGDLSPFALTRTCAHRSFETQIHTHTNTHTHTRSYTYAHILTSTSDTHTHTCTCTCVPAGKHTRMQMFFISHSPTHAPFQLRCFIRVHCHGDRNEVQRGLKSSVSGCTIWANCRFDSTIPSFASLDCCTRRHVSLVSL
jgi:hypothetical protein